MTSRILSYILLFTFISCKSTNRSINKSYIKTLQSSTTLVCDNINYSLDSLGRLVDYDLCRMFSLDDNLLHYNLETILSCISQNRNDIDAREQELLDKYITSIISYSGSRRGASNRFNCLEDLLGPLIRNKDLFESSLRRLSTTEVVYKKDNVKFHVGYLTSLLIVEDYLKGEELIKFRDDMHQFRLDIMPVPEHEWFQRNVFYLESYVNRALEK